MSKVLNKQFEKKIQIQNFGKLSFTVTENDIYNYNSYILSRVLKNSFMCLKK